VATPEVRTQGKYVGWHGEIVRLAQGKYLGWHGENTDVGKTLMNLATPDTYTIRAYNICIFGESRNLFPRYQFQVYMYRENCGNLVKIKHCSA